MIKLKNILIKLIDLKISILMKFKNILMSCVMIFGSLSLSGCYTQLSMFYPSPEIDEEVEQFYSYSVAGPMKSVSMYAQDGAGQSLSMAYTIMYNRFYGMYTNWGSQYGSGYYNKYDYYNRYGYHAGYNSYNIAGYKMYIPITQGERKPRTFSTDRGNNSPGTNLNTTRTRTESSTNGGYSNNSNISSTRSSSSSSTSANSSGGTRATRRN